MNYLIYSRKHTVHTPVWWGPNNAGYWEDLAGAGRYPADVSTVAFYSDKSASAENVAIPEEKVLALPQPVTVNALEAMLAGRESSKLDGINRAFMLRAVKNQPCFAGISKRRRAAVGNCQRTLRRRLDIRQRNLPRIELGPGRQRHGGTALKKP